MVDSACTCTCTHYCIKPFLNKPPIVALSQAPKPSLYAPYQQYRRPSLVFRCVGDWQLCSEYSLYLNCQRWGGVLPSVSRDVPNRFIFHIIPYTGTGLSTGTCTGNHCGRLYPGYYNPPIQLVVCPHRLGLCWKSVVDLETW